MGDTSWERVLNDTFSTGAHWAGGPPHVFVSLHSRWQLMPHGEVPKCPDRCEIVQNQVLRDMGWRQSAGAFGKLLFSMSWLPSLHGREMSEAGGSPLRKPRYLHCADWAIETCHCDLPWDLSKGGHGFDLGRDCFSILDSRLYREHTWWMCVQNLPKPQHGQTVLRLAHLEASTFLKGEVTMLITVDPTSVHN